MKKLFTLLFVALVAFGTAQAQNLKLGIKGGVSTRTYDFKSVVLDDAIISPGANGNIGYNIGLAMKLSFAKILYVQPELMFYGGNFDYVISTPGYNSKARVDVQRFELPVLVGFNIHSLRFFAGPKFILASSNSYSNQTQNFKVDFVDTDVAFQVGCGFDIKNFFVDVTYQTYFSSNYEKIYYNDDYSKVNVSDDSQWIFNVGFFF